MLDENLKKIAPIAKKHHIALRYVALGRTNPVQLSLRKAYDCTCCPVLSEGEGKYM